MKQDRRKIFTPLGASNHSKFEREKNDFYATCPKAIDYLLEVEKFNHNIWEPACGLGHLSERLKQKGYDVLSTDLIKRGYEHHVVDFLKCTLPSDYDIITNPPYKHAQAFVEKAIKLTKNKVAMFLKLTFLEGKARKELFKKYPPKTVYVSSSRIKCARNGKFDDFKSSAAAYAWFVWEKGYQGETIVKWIN